MSSSPQTQQLSLPELLSLLLNEQHATNRLIARSNEIQGHLLQGVNKLHELMDGFSSGGASFHAYQTDPFTSAYLQVVAAMIPVTPIATSAHAMAPTEVMKAAMVLSRQVLEELAAYREQAEGRHILEDALGSVADPWAQAQAADEPEEGSEH
jgi:hypothetical protein